MAVIINSKTKKMTLVESAGQAGKSTKRFKVKDYLRENVEHSLTVVIGELRMDTEYENEKHIKRFIKQRKSDGKDYRVVIIDFKDRYEGVKAHNLDDLSSFRNKVITLGNPSMTNKQRAKLIEEVCLKYNNGLLIIDDCQDLLSTKIKGLGYAIIGTVVTNRSQSLDVILGFGSDILDVPIKVLENTSFFRLHYTPKSFTDAKVKTRLYNPQIFELAQSVCLNQYNGDEFVVVDMEHNKIFSCTEKEYVDGLSSLIIDRVSCVTTLKGLEQFPFTNPTAYYLKQKHIPISNIYRDYRKNHG